MKAVVALAATWSLVACGARLGDPAVTTGDASPPTIDAPIAPVVDGPQAMIDAPAACPNHRQLFLEFDGVTLTKGSSDATTNHADWIGESDTQTTGIVPQYHLGSATRATDIQTIVNGVASYLANDPITIVTTRPATGPYVMVAFGGSMTDVGVPFSIAVNSLDCGDLVKNDVAWVSDSSPVDKAAGFAIGAVGYGLGLTATTSTSDCMCGWGNSCVQATSACTLSPSITAGSGCNTQTQNEVEQFHTEFCAN